MNPKPTRSTSAVRALDGLVSRYQLRVVATDPGDPVRFAGGLIFDKVTSGWDVIVLFPSGGDSVPLQILGATIGDLDDPAFVESLGPATALVAPADGGDERTKTITDSALTDRRTHAAFWCDSPAASNLRSFTTIDYHMSLAARAYKMHALAAAGFDTEPGVFVETFVNAPGRSQTGADLIVGTEPPYQPSAMRSGERTLKRPTN